MKKTVFTIVILIFVLSSISVYGSKKKNKMSVWVSLFLGSTKSETTLDGFLEAGFLLNIQKNNHLLRLAAFGATNHIFSCYSGDCFEDDPEINFSRTQVSYHYAFINKKFFQISIGGGLNYNKYKKVEYFYTSKKESEENSIGFSLEGQAMLKVFFFNAGFYGYINFNKIQTHSGFGFVFGLGMF